MLKTEKIKTHVVFSAELLKAIDKSVGGRKRSRFIVEAAKEKLEELKFQKALDDNCLSWSGTYI